MLNTTFGSNSELLVHEQDFSPHLVIAPNAGIAAYSSWLPTIVCVLILLTSHSHSLRLCLFVTEEAFTITSKQRAESACNFFFF